MLSRKDEVEKEKRVRPHIFLFAVKLLVSQKKTWEAEGCSWSTVTRGMEVLLTSIAQCLGEQLLETMPEEKKDENYTSM